MKAFDDTIRVIDTRLPAPGATVKAGTIHRIRVPDAVPESAHTLAITVVAVTPVTDGYLAVWKAGARKPGSCLNYGPYSGTISNSTIVPINDDRTFQLYTHGETHLIVDVNGSAG